MNTRSSSSLSLIGALVWMAGVSAPIAAAEARDVAQMAPDELRALFHEPGFSMPDGLGSYNEDYRSNTSASKKERQFEKSAVTVSGNDRGAICTALGDALNYLRGRALAFPRVAYGPDSAILRWYNGNCVTNERPERTRTTNNSVDPVTLKELRRIVVTHPQEYLDAY